MIPYILHVTIIITACFLFYKIFLQKETFFQLNRWTLLACVIISFLLPLIPVPQQWSWYGSDRLAHFIQMNSASQATATEATYPVDAGLPAAAPAVSGYRETNAGDKPSIKARTGTSVPSISPSGNLPAAAPASADTPSILNASGPIPRKNAILPQLFQGLYWIYLFGVVIFSAGFLLQIVILLYQAYTRPVVRDGRFRIVETTGDRAPCSFGNTIFINSSQYDWDTYNQILLHEKIHASGRHTIDILLAEILIAVQWFNPFAWLYRKEVENNLEFLTDESVLRHHEVERSAYQLSLLRVAAPNVPFSLTNNYNQSLLKRRIIMMNSKKSSLHTIWKYFFLLPLLTCLVLAFNKPAAFGQSSTATIEVSASQPANASPASVADTLGQSDRLEGAWFATTHKDQLCFEFRGDKDDHTWSSTACFLKSEFASLTGVGKVEFRLTREAGTILFTGQFDGEQGYGHYTFKPDENYIHTIGQKEITQLTDNDLLAFFLTDIKNEYVDMLQHNGFPHIEKNNLIAAKSLGIDKSYIEGLRAAGYPSLEINQLIAFKAQGIDGRYVDQLNQAHSAGTYPSAAAGPATAVPSGAPAVAVPAAPAPIPDATVPAAPAEPIPADDIIAFKSLNIDPAYITSLKAAGYDHLTTGDIIMLHSQQVDVAFIMSFQAAGCKDIPIHAIPTLKSLGITPEYINGFRKIGFKDISADQLPALKSLDITPDYVKSFLDIGYTNISLEQLPALKSMGITPEFIKAFRGIGFKDIPLDQLPALKSLGVTPAYVNKMKEKGFVSDDLNKYIQLKSAFQ